MWPCSPTGHKRVAHAKPVVLASAFLLVLATGCATTAPFHYSYSYPELAPQSASNFVLSLAPIRDARMDRNLDETYGSAPQATLDQILEQEVRSTGLFTDVSAVGAEEARAESTAEPPKPRLALTGVLHDLSWEVPDYEGKLAAAFVISFLTGGIGGIIYGSTPTDVYGKAVMDFELADEDTGVVLLKERYVGAYEERMSKFGCDTPKTKSRMAGEALADAIAQFKVDLSQVVRELGPVKDHPADEEATGS